MGIYFQGFVSLRESGLIPTQAISVTTVESALSGQEGNSSQEDEGKQRPRQESNPRALKFLSF